MTVIYSTAMPTRWVATDTDAYPYVADFYVGMIHVGSNAYLGEDSLANNVADFNTGSGTFANLTDDDLLNIAYNS